MFRIPVLFLFCFLIVAELNAQTIPFDNYTRQNSALPASDIIDILQDNKGYIWLATQVGAVKFDGYHFNTFSTNEGLSDNFINCLELDHQGRILAGTFNGGLNIIDDNRIEHFGISEGLPSNTVEHIFLDKQHRIWCLTDNGVAVIGKDSILCYSHQNSILTEPIFSWLVDHKGTVWLANTTGIYCYTNHLFKYTNSALSENIVIRNFLQDKNKNIWMSSEERGIIKISELGGVKYYDSGSAFNTDVTYSIHELKDGRIIVGTFSDGVIIINQDGSFDTRYSEITKDILVLEFLEDKQNRVWMRTNESGIFLINKEEILHLTEYNNLCNNTVSDILEDSNGNIWFSTLNGLSKYGKVIFEIYNQNLLDGDKNIYSIYIDSDNSIFAGSRSGLTILKNNKNPLYFNSKNGLPVDGSVYDIMMDSEKNIWLGTHSGLTRLKNNSAHTFKSDLWEEGNFVIPARKIIEFNNTKYSATSKGIIEFDGQLYKMLLTDTNEVKNLVCIEMDGKGNLWCASYDGLTIYDGANFHHYHKKDGLPSEELFDISFDSMDNGWVATSNGVSQIKLFDNYKVTCKNISTLEGLGSNSIWLIHADKKGHIWAGHNLGIDRINTNSLQIKNYSKTDGFEPMEVSLGAVFEDRFENIWFGTVDGIVKYTEQNDIKNEQEPKVYITNISVLNDSSSLNKYSNGIDSLSGLPVDLNLKYNKNNLLISYVALHFTNVKKNQYKYMLEGYDSEWSKPRSTLEPALYRKLPAGRYTFLVHASNSDNIWTKTPAAYTFTIKPPFWKTWWFYLIEILAGIAGIVAIMYLRERKLQQDKRILTQKVEERTLEIRKQKDQIEDQRDKISLQKKEITDSIHYAQKIQAAALPKQKLIDELLPENFILFKPRNIVSGDFYWIAKKNGKVILVVADCTGHGVPGGFMSMLGISILNEITAHTSHFTAGSVLNDLRWHIKATLSQTGVNDEAKDGMDLVLCIFDFEKKNIQFSGAYNPLFMIRNGELIVHKGDKMPIGIHPGEEIDFTTIEINYEPGDCFYMFSDGYADQFGGPNNKKFMTLSLKKLLVDICHKDLIEQKHILDKTIEDWKGEEEQVDDILIIGFRV